MSKKIKYQIYLIIVFSIALVGLLSFHLLKEAPITSLLTDSGFDTSYDSGGSSWGGSSGGGGSSWGSSGGSHDWGRDNYHSSSYGGSGSSDDPTVVILTFMMLTMMFVISLSKMKKKDLSELVTVIGLIYFLPFSIVFGLALLSENVWYSLIIFGCDIAVGIIYFMQEKKKKEAKKKKREELKKESTPYVEKAYQIFVDVQNAWMDFDYDALKRLVGDELYYSYRSQLESLKMKNQKNIMHDFEFLGGTLVEKKEEEDFIIITILLKTSFYDYIVNEKEEVLRGNKDKRVFMLYSLEFSLSKKDNYCPNCQAHIEDDMVDCPYCKSHIQGITGKMKLQRKNAMNQSNVEF